MDEIQTVVHVDDDDNDALLLKHPCRSAPSPFQIQVVNEPESATAYLSGQGRCADRTGFPLPALVLPDLKLP